MPKRKGQTKDRSAALDPARWTQPPGDRDPFSSPNVVDGWVVGGWRRPLRKGAVVIALAPFAPLNGTDARAVAHAAHRYGAFLGPGRGARLKATPNSQFPIPRHSVWELG